MQGTHSLDSQPGREGKKQGREGVGRTEGGKKEGKEVKAERVESGTQYKSPHFDI